MDSSSSQPRRLSHPRRRPRILPSALAATTVVGLLARLLQDRSSTHEVFASPVDEELAALTGRHLDIVVSSSAGTTQTSATDSTVRDAAIKAGIAPFAFSTGAGKMRLVTDAIATAFPGAMPGYAMFRKLLRAWKPYGVKKDNSIYGQSLCSDEINGDKGHINVFLAEYFGKVFHMGGIGGAPYVGKTGFSAFSNHVPDGGHVVVLFGPHVGLTPSGEVGKFHRHGQAHESTACGAAIAAYNQCTAGPLAADEQDMEQSWIRQKLRPKVAAVANAKESMVELSMQMYKCIEDEMLAIVNTAFGSGNLVLIGGIQLNMPYPMDGYFLPLHFSVRSASMEAVDLMPAFR